jgi:hypothetical protein
MPINPNKLAKIADSLRQYRRAELSDFQQVSMEEPVETLYVDPLESDAVLNTVLLNNTTFLIGRKGTGKSTVFARAQLEIRKRMDAISIYIDVKSLHELLNTNEAAIQTLPDKTISESVYRAHCLRKAFLSAVISDLVKELKNAYEGRSLFEKWISRSRSYNNVIEELQGIAADVTSGKLSQEEIPILRLITRKFREASKLTASEKQAARLDAEVGIKTGLKASLGTDAFDETVSDNEIYEEYADAVLRSFPFQNILLRIKELLANAKLGRLFVFFDDFSELSWIDQKLFVDVILSPLNNASDETIKLKVAGYPGRTYHGKIDPGKIDTLGLDFYSLYKSQDIQTSEAAAVTYLERLLVTRFNAFNENIADYFDPSIPLSEHYRLLFEVTLNVPRLIGYILHQCYLDKISKRQPITQTAIKLAAQKYYESVTLEYFDRMNRFAKEPFERKLDRHNQRQLLDCLIRESKSLKRDISTGKIGGKYFFDLRNPPVSHFSVSPSMEKLLAALELNFLLTKYHEMRDKNGKDVSIYALSYGLCESERFSWGYPRGRRDDRSYFVQRCFNYNPVIQQFLESNQTIRCDNCGACHGLEKHEMIELYKWRCPECQIGTCKIVALGEDFKLEVDALNKETMLPSIELEIMETLFSENCAMRAGEIASLIDTTYQLVGHRTTKLSDTGLVQKSSIDGTTRSILTKKAKSRYFGTAEEDVETFERENS